jgi:hypothetical protein
MRPASRRCAPTRSRPAESSTSRCSSGSSWCDFAVADLTTANANVFYELGVRHAVKPATTVLLFAADGNPPYELDPMLDNPVIRNRIGELIAKAAEKRFGGWSLRCR